MGWFHGLVPDGIVFRDFAGSTVVHTVGGVHRPLRRHRPRPSPRSQVHARRWRLFPPHDIVMASIGAVILWFGWYGFNPGSTLSAMDFTGIGRVAANTTLAACAAGLVAVFFVYPRSKKWDLGMALNGFLGGLVGITAPCYWVGPAGSLWIGAIAGIIVPLGVDLLERLKIDDPIGAVPVHMLCGIWGTLSVGIFATGTYGIPAPTGADNSAPIEGLISGGGAGQLVAQLIGSISCLVAVGGVAFVLMKALRSFPATGTCASAGMRSSRGSTSWSTALRRTTSRWATASCTSRPSAPAPSTQTPRSKRRSEAPNPTHRDSSADGPGAPAPGPFRVPRHTRNRVKET